MPTVEHFNQEIHFEEHGSGPAVVLGHSYLFDGSMWKHQVPALAEYFRVINIDFRGHGQSGRVSRGFNLYDAVGDVIAVLDHLQIERAAWCGLSVGGMVALRAALAYPHRVARLVLIDTDGGSETLVPRLKYAALSRLSTWIGIGPLLPFVARLMFGKTARKRHLPEIREWKQSMKRAHLPSLRYGIRAVAKRASMLATLPEITVPSLVIVGEEDRALPPDRSERLAHGLPNAHLVRIRGAGHISALEQPHVVTDAMFTFLYDGETW